MNLPIEIVSKISLYNSHPCSNMIREFWIHHLASQLLQMGYTSSFLLEFPIRRHEIQLLDDIMFRYSYFMYYIRFYPNLGTYGEIRIIDLEE